MNAHFPRLSFAPLFLAFGLLMASSLSALSAMKIQEVTSSKGVKAWLVEDYTVPIIAIRFAFGGGETQDPLGKDGITNLMTGLFDEGAGDLESEAFQIRLDDAGAEMSFNANRDTLYGSMRTLADQKDEAIELLTLAVNKPRFDQAPIERIRSQIVAGIIAAERTPQAAAGRKWAETLYGDHPYARRDEGTRETLASITAQDLRELHKAIFARGNLYVSVVGAIDAETLKPILDKVFGDLPEKPKLVPVPDATLNFGKTLKVDVDPDGLSERKAQRSELLRGLYYELRSGRRDIFLAAF
jgi:zinc protease